MAIWDAAVERQMPLVAHRRRGRRFWRLLPFNVAVNCGPFLHVSLNTAMLYGLTPLLEAPNLVTLVFLQ